MNFALFTYFGSIVSIGKTTVSKTVVRGSSPRGPAMTNLLKNDEYLDLVDKNDVVIGKKLRSEIYSEKLNNYRVINAFVVNNKGKLWIPRRTKDKKIFPLCLDMGLAEHVQSGENYEEGLRRGAKEELNLDLKNVEYKLLGNLNPQNSNVSSFMNVYEIKMNEAPNYNPKDFIEYFWLTPEEVLNKIKCGENSKDDLPKLIEKFYLDN